jgi:predicted acylesterase/phospholipase RssA
VAGLFDLIAGTSTGGIIALAVTRPGQSGSPAWTAEQVVELYEREGPRIFARGPLHSLHGIFDQRYDAAKLQDVLEHYCGASRLSDSTTPVLIPAYDVVRRNVYLFNSALAGQDPAHDYLASFVGRATSAAPTYFEPPATPGEELVFVDGGVFANNPAMCAFTEAQRVRPGSEVMLVSLGAGSQTRPLPSSEIRHWGLAQWARPILHVVLDAVSIAIDQQLIALLGPERYWRFQVELTHARDDIDDASPENLDRLREEAARLIEEQSERLDRILERLLAREPLQTNQ